MLLGILDQDGVEETPAPGPEAGVSLDFVNGVYVVNGSSVTAASIVDTISLIVPGSGLKDTDFPTYASGLSVSYIGGARTALTASSLTVVMELTLFTLSADGFHYPSYPINIDKNGSVFYAFQFGVNSNGTVTVFENGQVQPPGRRIDTVAATYGSAGIHRFGFTLTPQKMAISMDGSAVEVDTHLRVGTPPLWPVDQAAVGWYSGQTAQSNDLYIRTVDVYDELADAVLQSLTA